jgi:ABC-type polysaccharide/polyol phosphate transport system ATPase subunit
MSEVETANSTARPASAPAIILEGITKQYRTYSTPQDRLLGILGLRISPERTKDVRAVDAISLTLNKGEFCGIIGRNGAGKSTLLRIIAGQLTPTFGVRRVFGRIGLLQLGRGFDRELTGRENVCNALRLMLLDVSVPERLVEEIVDFAGIGDFINFPLKTYSSGMYSRLAFATAVSIAPDILIADEVLAVGDANFSQKCLRKMREFKQGGKTVILVTHDLNSVRVFCDRAVLIDGGHVVMDGDPQAVCERFRNLMLYGIALEGPRAKARPSADDAADASGMAADRPGLEMWDTPRAETFVAILGKGAIKGYRLRERGSDEIAKAVTGGALLCFDLLFYLDPNSTFSSAAFTMHDDRGQIVLHLNSEFGGLTIADPPPDNLFAVSFSFQMPYLRAGSYSFSYGVCIDQDGVGAVAFKHDFDFSVEVAYAGSPKLDHQGGLVLIPEFSVRELPVKRPDQA